jgi:hypothetical protein
MTPRKLYPGQTLTASEQNALMTKVMRMDRVSSAGLTSTVKDNGETRIRDNRLDIIQARITGAPTGAAYPYIEVAPNDDGTYTDAGPPFGREGTTTDLPAYERAGRTDVPTGAIVELTPLPDGGGWAFSWGATVSGITTGNVGDSGVQDSTTTVLRFNESTRIKVTKGATAGDPDVVSMTGISATTSGLTIPGTTVSGVVTATRNLPALPRCGVRFTVVAGTVIVSLNFGLTATVTRTGPGAFQIAFAGVDVNGIPLASAYVSGAIATANAFFLTGVLYLFTRDGGVDTDPFDASVMVFY